MMTCCCIVSFLAGMFVSDGNNEAVSSKCCVLSQVLIDPFDQLTTLEETLALPRKRAHHPQDPTKDVKSGPRIGERIRPFHVLAIIHAQRPDQAGARVDFIEEYGSNQVALVFAREVNDNLVGLLKKVDDQVANSKDRKGKKLRALTIILSDEGNEETLVKKFKDLVEKQGIKHTSLAIMLSPGPHSYSIAREAEVTVIVYEDQKVKATHAFKKGKMNDKSIDAIIADISKR